MIYFVFVFFGGQRAADENRYAKVPCPYCGAPRGLNPGALCSNCGHMGEV
jgi:hypothetical protein